MSNHVPREGFSPVRFLQKFVVSTFVVCTFLAYAVHEHFSPNDPQGSLAPAPTVPVAQAVPDVTDQPPQLGLAGVPTATPASRQAQPTPTRPAARPSPTTAMAPTTVPNTAARANGSYKDGTYTGPSVNAMWGLVRVQAVVQNGKLANVQVLEYPSDRRTSQRINQQAIPWLQQEVIQAQSANVDFISGATLTSQAFVRSLQAALAGAKG